MFSFQPTSGIIPSTSMQIDGGVPRFGMGTSPGVHQESLTMKSRFDDPGNAMTHTQLIDTMLDRVPCYTTDKQSVLSYEQQHQALQTGTFALTCYAKDGSRFGQSSIKTDVTPLMSMPMWNLISRHNFDDKKKELKYDVNFAGSVRDNQPAHWAHRGKPLRSVSTHVGGMVGGEVSDAIVRASANSPIIAGSYLYHVNITHNGHDIHAIFVDNAKSQICSDIRSKISTLDKHIKNLKFNTDGSCNPNLEGECKTLPIFWKEFGESFCNVINAAFHFWKNSESSLHNVKVTQIGRIGRAAWATSSEPSNYAQIALTHFSSKHVPHKGTLDVLYCDA